MEVWSEYDSDVASSTAIKEFIVPSSAIDSENDST